MQERRKFARLSVKVKVKWRKLEKSIQEEPDLNDDARNISRGGICIITHKPLKTGTSLHLDIVLPTGKSIAAAGRVAWVKNRSSLHGIGQEDYDVGVEFLRMSNDDREEIYKFIFESLN